MASAPTGEPGLGRSGRPPGRARLPWPAPLARSARQARAARAHWWSIQPPPVQGISARRAYGEVLGVFAVFFAAGIVAGGETLAGRYPPPAGSWAVFTPAAIGELATAALAVLVTVLLSARRGLTRQSLGLCLPRKDDGTPALAQAMRIGVWAVMALVAAGAILNVLASGRLGQPAHQDASYLLYTAAASLAAGVVEETVVLAFLVTTLRQAGRPLPEIVVVATVLRCSYHDYYGPGVAGIALWAIVFVWLFLRTGSVLPLVIVHILWDATIFLGQRWHAVQVARAEVVVLLPFVAVITWLVEVAARGGRRQEPPPGPAGPAGRLPPS